MKAFRHCVFAWIGLGILALTACQKSGDSGSAPSRKAVASEPVQDAASGSTAWKTDFTKVCALPSARPAALKQNLGWTDSIGAMRSSSVGRGSIKCLYSGKRQLTIEVEQKGGGDLASVRRMFKDVPGTLKDYPGFGDEAFLFIVPLGTHSFHSLVVLKGGIMMVFSAEAEVEAIRKAAALLYQDMGIAI